MFLKALFLFSKTERLFLKDCFYFLSLKIAGMGSKHLEKDKEHQIYPRQKRK